MCCLSMSCILFRSSTDIFVTYFRSMLKVVVDDGDSTATFELVDYLLQGIPSLSYNDLASQSII